MLTWRPQPPATTISTFSRAEQEVLDALRARYRQSRDLFSTRELARLSFVRWLYEEGELGPVQCPPRYARRDRC